MSDNLSKLPDLCYGKLDSTGETIIIKRGVSGYFPSVRQDAPEELNNLLGVTKAQAQAMKFGSLFGWNTPGADPDHWATKTTSSAHTVH